MADITWLNRHPEICHPLETWDTWQVQELLAGLAEPHLPIYVVSGRFHASDEDVEWVLRETYKVPQCIIIVTSDEESLFPWWKLRRAHAKLWVMTPRPADIEEHGSPDVILGEGPTPRAREWLQQIGYQGYRELNWAFAGQITHERREQAAEAMKPMVNGAFIPTEGFTQGLDAESYYTLLSNAVVAPCPSGPATPDSFRVYEALMAGCVPILDNRCPAYKSDEYWNEFFANPIDDLGYIWHWNINDWSNLPGYVHDIVTGWDKYAHKASASYSMYTRWLRLKLEEHSQAPLRSDITVLITTSPSQKHPDTAILEETIKSVRDRLPEAEILIVADGIRKEQEHLQSAYGQYLHHVAWLCNVQWERAALFCMPSHHHQALSTKAAMKHVNTPYILFMEHDTPLQGEFNFQRLERVLASGQADLIRFHHESRVLEEHAHLMVGPVETNVFGLTMQKTKQWSQRPHLATSAYYRHILDTYFGDESKSMIEDTLYGTLKNLVDEDEMNWYRHRVWMYMEEDAHGSIQHSYHLDGRGTDPKYDMKFSYPGETPRGAPAPTKDSE